MKGKHGGHHPPKSGVYTYRETPRKMRDVEVPSSVAFLMHDRIERALAHDDLAYRVRRMLDSRDLWTVVPEPPGHASTAYEREFFDDLGSHMTLASPKSFRDALLVRRHQNRVIRSRMTEHNRRVLGND